MNKFNAKNLINHKRLDVIVKYLFAKEILEHNDYTTDCYKDLYIRHILMRTMGIEPIDLKGNVSSKCKIDDYLESFNNLIQDIKNNGYDKDFPIPIANNGLLSNGAHRLAASLALGNDVCIEPAEIGFGWGFDWFCQNGFNTEDKQRILKGFVDTKAENCSIFVVWNPLFKYLDNVKSIINKYFDIVGDVELDFEDNYIAFTNVILEIYEPNISKTNDETVILEKAKLLQASYLNFKVIVVTNQDKNQDKDIFELTKACKDEIRNLFNHVLPKECFCTVHSSDCEAETKYLAAILLSPNNIKHLKMRLSTEYANNFVQEVRSLSRFLQTKGIPSNEVSVIGTGVLTALGIQKEFNSDIDFIIDHKYRENYGWGAVKLSDKYDIGVSSKLANGPIHDNIIIYNDEYHFWFKGIKFANLEIIKDRKSVNPRPKDLIHLRQIELFEKMTGNINQQKILMERIEIEKQRRFQLQSPIVNSKVSYSNYLEKIFSVKNEISNNRKYKVLTVLGIKFKFKKG